MREQLAQGCDLKARRPEVNTRGLELMLGRREADVRREQMSYIHISSGRSIYGRNECFQLIQIDMTHPHQRLRNARIRGYCAAGSA